MSKKNYSSTALTFEFSDTGVCTLFINTRKTIFKSADCRYDKIDAVFVDFFNHHFDVEKFLKEKLIKGTGIYAHANILEKSKGFNLEFITETKNAIIYKLIYDERFLNTDKKDELYL